MISPQSPPPRLSGSEVVLKNVIMINLIEVKEEMAEEFLARWDKVTQYMQKQPGFVQTQLHRRFDDPSRWVNVAEFTSVRAIKAAFANKEFELISGDYPGRRDIGLYAIVRSTRATKRRG